MEQLTEGALYDVRYGNADKTEINISTKTECTAYATVYLRDNNGVRVLISGQHCGDQEILAYAEFFMALYNAMQKEPT
jgi:hypothetical protein